MFCVCLGFCFPINKLPNQSTKHITQSKLFYVFSASYKCHFCCDLDRYFLVISPNHFLIDLITPTNSIRVDRSIGILNLDKWIMMRNSVRKIIVVANKPCDSVFRNVLTRTISTHDDLYVLFVIPA